MKFKTHADEREVTQGGLDPSSQRSLGIKRDKDVLSAEQQALVTEIIREYDLTDFTFTNAYYGPCNGICPGERLIRAQKLGLLKAKPRSKASTSPRQRGRRGQGSVCS